MENLEQNTDPLGEAGATASQGQSDATGTQLVETTDAVSDGQVAEAGQASNPWDNDPRFKGKSAEDIYKYATEAEKVKGQLSQKAELANLIEQQTGMSTQQIKEQLAYQQQQQMAQAIQENPGLAAYQEVQNLKGQLAIQAEQKELDSFLQSEEGKPYTSFRDKILNLGLKLETDKTYGEIAREYFGQSRAQGQQDAYQKIETKIMNQATGSKSSNHRSISSDEMKGMSTSEMETFLPRA